VPAIFGRHLFLQPQPLDVVVDCSSWPAANEPAAPAECEICYRDASTLNSRNTDVSRRDVRSEVGDNLLLQHDKSLGQPKSPLENNTGNVNHGAYCRKNLTASPPVKVGVDRPDRRVRGAAYSDGGPDQHTRADQAKAQAHPSANDADADPPGQAVEYSDPDWLVFAAYQPVYRRPYDLKNCFDRTNLAIVIRGYIDRCESYIDSARRLHSEGAMSARDFAQGAGVRLADLREHRNALFRLNELGSN
jgi:hypothetical protein